MRAVLPPALVPAANAFIAGQGGAPDIFLNDGTLNPGGVLSMFFDQAEVKTSITPSLLFPINAHGAPPNAVTQDILNRLQPTVILSGPAGRIIVSPYGAAQGATSWWPIALIGGAVVLVGGWLLFGRRR